MNIIVFDKEIPVELEKHIDGVLSPEAEIASMQVSLIEDWLEHANLRNRNATEVAIEMHRCGFRAKLSV